MHSPQGQVRSVSVRERISLFRGTLGLPSSFSDPFLRLSSPSPHQALKTLLSPLATFLEMKETDVCHLSCPWRWGRGQRESNLKVKRTLFIDLRIFPKDGLGPSFCALVRNPKVP